MSIVDLSKEYESLYFVCLEDWSDEMKEAGCHKQNWYAQMKDKGLLVKLAITEGGTAAGMIEFLPVEHSIAEGRDLYFINCLWVHGHKQGIGDQRKHGYGKALLAAAEEEAKARGAKGMAAHGIVLPFWIPSSFYKKHGYQVVDKDGMMRLLFKPFSPDAQKPAMIKALKKPQKQQTPGKVTLTYLLTGSCPACSIVYERAKRAAAEFGDRVILQMIDTSDRDTYLAWGNQNALFIEDQLVGYGPPLSYNKIKRKIAKHLRRLS